MSRYKNERFNFSGMSERLVFLTQGADGSYSDDIKVWAHVLKDGFIRSETDSFFKIMVREQKALTRVLAKGNRIKWRNYLLSIMSWQDPSYEDRGFIEIMAKQISNDTPGEETTDNELFKDIVSVYRMNKVETVSYGLTTYKYEYDFDAPNYTEVRCDFATDRNQYLDDKNIDVEHDSVRVKFALTAPIKVEDYIESPLHGRFKIDMIVKNDDNMLEALCQRREVQ